MEPMRAVLAAKFWNQEVESTNSFQAVVHSVPCEPPHLGAEAISLAAMLCARNVLHARRESWWATVTWRARAQRLWWLEKQLGENISQTPEPLSPQEKGRWWHRRNLPL
ncbi:hypothetical protein R1sor_003339 [Riccia sorocarpa]|uniref:Uncharacterized protein n=1 Tax=Riccia sorocarpa TaxID=122646 RepID=A0ABD3H413_9MARC